MSDSAHATPVSLSREPAFALGRLEIRPASREIVAPDFRDMLEPRVMQVLVALAKRRGEVVSRDELALTCWDGRVVGEDAINRVISRLRRLSERDGGASFTLETITKVGYRLVEAAPPAELPTVPSEPVAEIETPAPAPSTGPARSAARRAIWIAAIVAVLAAGALAAWLLLLSAPQQHDARDRGPDRERHSDSARADFNAAKHGIDSGIAEDIARSVALLESVVQREPDWPEAWGCLAVAYLSSIEFTPPKSQDDRTKQARDAATRAVQLRPDQFQGNFVLAALTPLVGHWLEQRRTFQAMIDRSPGATLYVMLLANLASSSGSPREALSLWERISPRWRDNPRQPGGRASLLAAIGRTDEAGRVLDDAARQWPRNIPVFFSTFWFDLFSGHPEKALALIDDETGRPTGIDPQDFELYRAAAIAFITRKPEDIAKALGENIAAGKRGRGYATNAMRMASALGDLDLAFQLADRVYFDRGEPLGALLFSGAQGQYATVNFRPLWSLFDISTAAMRRDMRIVPVFEELGLGDYWRRSGRWPDFCASDPAAAAVCAKLKAGG